MEKNTSIEYTKDSFRMIYSRFSHEIRNPLAIVQSELQLLSDKYPEVTDYEEWDTVQDNLQYMQELLKEFSDYNSAKKLSRHPTDISAYLQDIAKAIKPSMDYLGISFSLQISSNLPVLSIDRIKLRQVLFNLLRNAQEAMPDNGGEIQIRAENTKENKVCISVMDSGCGISPKYLPDIFTPFVTFQKNGSGLGLAIAKQIVEAHSGRLTVESRPGEGSVFSIFLA